MKKTITIFGHTREVDVISNEEYDAMMSAQRQRDLSYRIEENRAMCFSDKLLASCTFESDDQTNAQLSKRAREYVNSFSNNLNHGKGILFYGTVGTGKTFMSACIANALLDLGYSCHMTTFARISNELQATWNKQEYINRLMRYDLLIIDDLAAERDNEYMNEIVFNVIDERNRCRKPLIVTTNLTGEELKRPADRNKSRIYSRLFEMCIPFQVGGNDRRKKELLTMLKKDSCSTS